MPGIPVLRPREVIAILISWASSNYANAVLTEQFRHLDGRATTVPAHAGRDISPILLRQIAKDIGLTMDQFLQHR